MSDTFSAYQVPTGRARRGSALVITLWITAAIAALTLLFARSARVETLASANQAAAMQADAVAKGAVQYLMSYLDGRNGSAPAEGEIPCEAVALGGGYFWILRRPASDETGYTFGVTDESAKLNVNAAWLTPELLLGLPGMTPEAAASIVAWRNAPGDAPPEGAQSDYYLSLPDPYYCKNAPFETVEELLLVKGVTPELLFGLDANRNGVIEEEEIDPDIVTGDEASEAGIYGLVTCYSAESVTQGGRGRSRTTRTVRGALNVNTAPREALLCLPGLDESDVDALIAYRAGAGVSLADVGWVARAITSEKADPLTSANIITTRSFQYSADILAVTGDGRAFRRYRVVLDTLNSSPPKVLYWKDITSLGWPISAETRTALRSGGAVASETSTGNGGV